MSNFYFLPKSLLTRKSITAITATTIKIPTPIPALNMPPITSQLVNENNTTISSSVLVKIFFMIFCFNGSFLLI